MRHVHPSESLCLPASKALSLHGRAVLLISGIWDYCKLNLPTWELLELQSFPWKRGSDRESELSPVCSRGRIRSELARAGELQMDGSQNDFWAQWTQREEAEPWPWPGMTACSAHLCSFTSLPAAAACWCLCRAHWFLHSGFSTIMS